MVTTHSMTEEEEVTTSLTPDEEEAVLALIQLSQTHPIQHNKKMKAEQPKKRQRMEEDDSEETLRMLLNWNQIKPEKPPLLCDLMGVCSMPKRKQLQDSDVNKDMCRLLLGKAQVKNMMQQVMEEDGTKELKVSVYGSDGSVRKMIFKMWSKNTPVLKSKEWNNFVADYDLTKHCDFLTIWMFRHRVSDEICFAIDKTRHPAITQPLSKRISNAVFNPKS